jgi:CRISPR-associated protein Csm4
MFAPYSHENIQYLPGLGLAIFAAVDPEALDAEALRLGFERIGSWGFGRDASTGLGRFKVVDVRSVSWPRAEESHTACYTLGPCVPQKETFARCLATPFTRFGRHGAALAASGNPFKKPVVMADEGALLYPVDRAVLAAPCIGTAVGGVSTVDQRTVVQGYTLHLPC